MKIPGYIFVFVTIICFKSFSQNYYEQGFKQYYEGHDDKISVELFTKAIDSKQEVSKSYMMRGAAKIALADYASAILDLEYSAKLDSTNYKTYFYLGRVYFVQAFYNISINYFDKAIAKYPMDADVFDDRAIAKAKCGNYKDALEDANIAVNINPQKGDYFVNRGYIKYELKMYNESINDFNIALSLGDFPRAYTNRGNSYAALKMYEKALSDLNIALKKMPDAIDIPYFRGLVLKEQGKTQEACIEFTKSSEKGFPPAIIAQKECQGIYNNEKN